MDCDAELFQNSGPLVNVSGIIDSFCIPIKYTKKLSATSLAKTQR